MDQHLFNQLNKLNTEQRNPDTLDIDLADALTIAKKINDEDKKVADAVSNRLPEIAQAIDWVAQSLAVGGRLLYFGAGTSGRLGVLDAAECPPTFGTQPEQVQGFIAGGEAAMFVAQERAEDSEELGAADLNKLAPNATDVICGIAASGRTPYVHGAIKRAREIGCKTIFVTTVPREQLNLISDAIIDVPVGPEVIMGSTRMKSATAQKMILNMITTGAMIRQGKVYENVMVDLMLTNAKLVERAKRILMTFTSLDYISATQVLDAANGHVKTALVMALTNTNKEEAEAKLEANGGFIRKALSM
jgi:N-acetylmuramic acid 6-phosphate etherase